MSPGLPTLGSQFQQRMSEGDVRGNALERLLAAAADIDLLLIDLCDERLGVVKLAEGRYLTRSVERLQGGAQEPLDAVGEVLPFGGDEHVALWRRAAAAIVIELRAVGLAHKTLVLAPDWALLDEQATPTPLCFGMPAVAANQCFEDYYQALAEEGLAVARIRGTLGDSQHKWGPAAFHYHEETYRMLVAEIERFVERGADCGSAEGDPKHAGR